MSQPVILDMDPGIDDAVALAVALYQPTLDIKLITTVAGNVEVAKTTANALKIVEFFHVEDHIPVAQGAATPLKKAFKNASYIHGESGMPGYSFPPLHTSPLSIGACDAMAEVISKSSEPVTIIGTGAYTNIAHLITAYPDLKSRINRLILMGGSLSGGNVNSVAEFNVFTDPDAAQLVLHSGLSCTLIGLDVTLKALLTPASWQYIHQVNANGHMLASIMQAYGDNHHEGGLPMHDVNTILYAVHPEWITTRPACLEVVTTGFASGATVDDFQYRCHPQGSVNAQVGIGINATRFNEWLCEQVKLMDAPALY